MDKPTMFDLFSGSGGVTLGFKLVGFKVLAAVEIDPVTAETYGANHPEVRLYQTDIRKVDPVRVMEETGLRPEELTVLSICAPCQPFSRQNRSTKWDPRAELILEGLKFVNVLKPRYVFLENVPGLGKGSYKRILDEFVEGLKKEGYDISEPRVLDAVDYGVPQFRKRLFLLAGRSGERPPFPEPTHAPPGDAEKNGKAPWRTVFDAIGDLPPLESGERDSKDPLHRARKHSALSLERLKHIPHNGGSRKSLPLHLQLACHVNGNGGYNDVYGRMDFSKPSNTLTNGCTNITKGRFAHPVQDRAITPREAARLQTFPDWYIFRGNYEKISSQIGNAVPVLLAKKFAEVLHKKFSESVKD